MSTEADLLDAIAAAPDDDAPRLVYADWLLQRGDRRGELITVQCEQARTRWYEPRHVELRRHAGLLLAESRDAWLGALADLDLGAAPAFELRRGMIEGVIVDGTDRLERAGPALFDWTMIHRLSLALYQWALPSWPYLDRVDELELRDGPLEPATARELLDSPRFRARRLDLTGCLVTTTLRPLVEAAGLDRVELLRIRGRWWEDEGACSLDELCERLAERSAARRALRGLSLHPQHELLPLGPAGYAAIAELALERLWLDGNPTGDRAAELLAASPRSRSLRGLSLRDTRLGHDGVIALARSPHLTGLAWLDVSANPLSPDDLRVLDAAPELPPDVAILVDAPPPSSSLRLRALPANHQRADDFFHVGS